MKKPDWSLILLVLLVGAMIGINEAGYGVFSLFLLFPALILMEKVFKDERNQT